MRIAVLGTGPVGKVLAAGLSAVGHDVTMGTRDVDATLARNEPDQFGNPPVAKWLEAHAEVRIATFSQACEDAVIVVVALPGDAALAGLDLVGADRLAGRILLDVSNPLDFSAGFPPTLSIVNDDSLGETIQRRFPTAKVVKTLNTVNAALMVEPRALAGGDHTLFVCGDDDGAKVTVTDLLGSFGWADIIDLGDISQARGTEMYLALWTRLYGLLGTGMFSIKVVR